MGSLNTLGRDNVATDQAQTVFDFCRHGVVYERVERLKDTPFDCWCSLMLIISIRLGNAPV